MKIWIAAALALSLIVPHVSRAADDSFELRQALTFLNGRVEIHDRDNLKWVKRSGWVIGALGLIPFTKVDWGNSVAEAGQINGAFIAMGVAIIATGIAINVGGQLYPILKARWIGDDGARFANDSNMIYFFKLPIERQYQLASRDAELRTFVMDLAKSYGFIARAEAARH